MYTAIGIIVSVILFVAIIISYLEYKEEQKEVKEKCKTRTGALENDRIFDRTTILKKK